MKDLDTVTISFDMRVGEVQLRMTRMLEPDLWRQSPLSVMESEVREMIMQLLAPAVTAYDQRLQSRAVAGPVVQKAKRL